MVTLWKKELNRNPKFKKKKFDAIFLLKQIIT